MEPVTHLLTGACLARAGFNRRAAYATLAMTLAAEMPDLDVLWGVRGPVAAFEHHRGITHTLLGLPFEAAVLVGAVWGAH
ncbi:MAG: metal-dependent hydrolase, partial [Acidobacteriota bacterium]|nr:metal-dependent hydrolase [Acidobacteriota bacterium]